jgi:nucleoid-associated protein YgaU
MPRGGGAPATDAADEAAESVVVTSDDGAPKADAVARDSADDDDNNDAGADDDDDVSDVDLDDAWVYDDEDVRCASEVLSSFTKSGLRDSQIKRIIKNGCSLWQPGDPRAMFVMARWMKKASQDEACRAQLRTYLLA